MCMSCGCEAPNDDHGNERNITQDDLDRAAQAANISREEAAENIVSCCPAALPTGRTGRRSTMAG